jgi:hypothetical protein
MFWVTDPDRNLWEIYTVEKDIDRSGFDGPPAPASPSERRSGSIASPKLSRSASLSRTAAPTRCASKAPSTRIAKSRP